MVEWNKVGEVSLNLSVGKAVRTPYYRPSIGAIVLSLEPSNVGVSKAELIGAVAFGMLGAYAQYRRVKNAGAR